MLLADKVAVIYGAGAIGRAVAGAFAREGARVFVASRHPAEVDGAETVQVDALDERAVTEFVDGVAGRAGRVDISFNLISVGDVQKPLLELAVDDFLQPISITMRSQFLTTKAAARHMIEHGSGVILAFGGSGPQTVPGMGGFKISLDALEGLRRQWAAELGPHGIRVVTLKTGGIPETLPADFPGRDELIASLSGTTLLNRTATLADVGNVAAFVASDQARTMTAADVNISCGAIID